MPRLFQFSRIVGFCFIKLFFLILLLFSTLVGYLAYTESGAYTLYRLAALSLPYTIKLESIEGYLAGPMTINQLSIQTPDLALDIGSLHLSWKPWDLFQRQLNIEQLFTQDMSINFFSSPTTHSATTWSTAPTFSEILTLTRLPLPITLNIKQGNGKNLQLKHQAQKLWINHLDFSNYVSNATIPLKSLSINSQWGYLQILTQPDFSAIWDLEVPNFKALFGSGPKKLSSYGAINAKLLSSNVPAKPIEVFFKALDWEINSQHFENLELMAEGDKLKHQIHFRYQQQQDTAQGIIQGHWNTPTWDGALKHLHYHSAKHGKLPTTHGKLQLIFDERLHANAALKIWGNNLLELNAKLTPHFPFALQGQLQGNFEQLGALHKLLPEVQQPQGKLQFLTQLQGTLLAPNIETFGQLTDAKFFIPRLGATATVDQLTFRQHDKQWQTTGHGYLGQGALKLHGETDATQTFILKLTGEQLQVAATPDYFIKVSPDLSLRLGPTPTLTGKLVVNEARLELPEFSERLAPSSDVVILQEQNNLANIPAPHFMQNLATQITINLSDNVHYIGKNLNCYLKGQWQIITQPNEQEKATGTINLVKGYYQLRGKALELSHGQILYSNSPLNNPALNIVAQRKVHYVPPSDLQASTMEDTFHERTQQLPTSATDIVVGIAIKGTLQNPELKLYSKPTIAQADILSLLIMDKPNHQISQSQSEILVQATSELLKLTGFNKNGTDIAQKLHLDKLDFKNMSGGHGLESAAVVIGKQLSSRLYAEYSWGLLEDTANTLSLRYLLSKHLSIEANTSYASSSGDILLNFESN